MRNISSPLESVAPMMRSGSRPRANPLSFSGCKRTSPSQSQQARPSSRHAVFLDRVRHLIFPLLGPALLRCSCSGSCPCSFWLRLRLPLPASLVGCLLRLQELRDQVWAVEVVLRLPGVVLTETQELNVSSLVFDRHTYAISFHTKCFSKMQQSN